MLLESGDSLLLIAEQLRKLSPKVIYGRVHPGSSIYQLGGKSLCFALLSLNDHQGSRDNSACLTEFLGGVNEILDIKHPSCCLAQGQCSVDVIEGI